MSSSSTVSMQKGVVRRNANIVKIPETARLVLKNPKLFSSILRSRKTHPGKATSGLTFWLPLSEAEISRLRLRPGDRVSVAIVNIDRAEEQEEETKESLISQ
jgi:protein involved in polysaccharide export with SLBB domain